MSRRNSVRRQRSWQSLSRRIQSLRRYQQRSSTTCTSSCKRCRCTRPCFSTASTVPRLTNSPKDWRRLLKTKCDETISRFRPAYCLKFWNYDPGRDTMLFVRTARFVQKGKDKCCDARIQHLLCWQRGRD